MMGYDEGATVLDEKKCAEIDAYWDKNWQDKAACKMKHSKSWRGAPEWYIWEGPHFVPNERKQPILPTPLPIPWGSEVNEPTNRAPDMLQSLVCHQGGPNLTKERLDQLFEEDFEEIEQPCPREAWSEDSSNTSQAKASNPVEGLQETFHDEHHPIRKFAT